MSPFHIWEYFADAVVYYCLNIMYKTSIKKSSSPYNKQFKAEMDQKYFRVMTVEYKIQN